MVSLDPHKATFLEFYYTEKQHCEMIIFLQQVYQVGLRTARILNENELNQLIPDVLDSLLDFHLQLLRKIRKRQHENIVVEKISDIIISEVRHPLEMGTWAGFHDRRSGTSHVIPLMQI